jgi:hypothetical protein
VRSSQNLNAYPAHWGRGSSERQSHRPDASEGWWAGQCVAQSQIGNLFAPAHQERIIANEDDSGPQQVEHPRSVRGLRQ